MSENPYQSPSLESHQVVGVRSGDLEDVKRVASYQKSILVCILIYFIGVFGAPTVPPEFRPFVAIALFAVIITGTIFVFLLAIKVYSVGVGILLGILALVPCVGLLVLLLINGKATRILKQNGIKVGLLGANMSQFR